MPIHFFGSLFGENAYKGLATLALTEGQVVRRCAGTSDEQDESRSALRVASTVVIDLTAFATLRLLGLERILTTKRFRFVVSQGTWSELNTTLVDSISTSGDSGTFGYQDGQYIRHEQSAEAKRQQKKELEAFLDQVRVNLEISPTSTLAVVDPSTRESLVKLFGDYGAEALAIARSPDHVLWTDDITQAQIAAGEFGTRRAWTQILLASLVEAGFLTRQDYVHATAKLLGMQYVSTTFDCPVIFEALRLSEFTPNRSPLKEVLGVFSNPQGDAQGLLRLFAEFVVRLHQEQFLDVKRCLVVSSFLDALWSNPAARNVLLSTRRLSSRLFGLNVIGEQEFNACFDSWFGSKGKSIL